jgi:hypothetical protein
MRSVLATPSALSLTWGCDTLASLAAPDFARLVATRVSWRAGYIDHVTPAELAAQLAANILFSPVTYALETDPLHTTQRLAELGIPSGATVWLDIERAAAALEPTTIKTKINAWAAHVQVAGFEAGLYVGAGTPLDAQALYSALRVTRYWHSLSDVPNVATRGYCARQIRPNDVTVGGEDVDIDIVEPDYKGDLPTFVAP